MAKGFIGEMKVKGKKVKGHVNMANKENDKKLTKKK